MIHFGLLGCGRIGQVHARNLAHLPDAKLVAVADALPAAASALGAAHGADVREADALIAAPDVDAVIIGTPTTTHYDLVHQAAAAGKAIFCEKPVDLSVDRVRDCINAVDAAGVPFLTAFQRRFDPHIAALARRLHGGDIGAPELIMLTSRDPGPPPVSYIETSGGIFRDMMIHDLDVARFLLSEEPVEIFATGACHVDPAIGAAGDIDTAAVTLKTASGRICQISCSRRATYGYDQRIEVHGQTGMLTTSNKLETLVEHADATGFTRAAAEHSFLERYQPAYAAEMAYFVDAVAKGVPLNPSIEDGLAAQILADAATRSWESGQVVRFS